VSLAAEAAALDSSNHAPRRKSRAIVRCLVSSATCAAYHESVSADGAGTAIWPVKRGADLAFHGHADTGAKLTKPVCLGEERSTGRPRSRV
jgi:hypothetical protein